MRNLTATDICLILFISACLGWTFGLLRLQSANVSDATVNPDAGLRNGAPTVSRPSASRDNVRYPPADGSVPVDVEVTGNVEFKTGDAIPIVGVDATSTVTAKPEPEPSLMDPGAVRFESSNVTFARKRPRIVIDAGHGGPDPGSVGPTGFAEKDLVLDLSKRLKSLLEVELGTEVILTRSEDTFLALESRTQIANQEQADLFISLHANSSPLKTIKGAETFVLDADTRSRDALTTAARENASFQKRINDLPDILSAIAANDKKTESRKLANYVQTALSAVFNVGAARGVHGAPLVVLIGARMPAVLVEVSYISNPAEEQRLRSSENRQQIAKSLFKGIKSYTDTLDSTQASNLATTR